MANTFESLAGDMARGEGEHLAALATLLGVPAQQQPEFFTLVQSRYRDLTDKGDASPSALIKALDDAMSGHARWMKVARSQP